MAKQRACWVLCVLLSGCGFRDLPSGRQGAGAAGGVEATFSPVDQGAHLFQVSRAEIVTEGSLDRDKVFLFSGKLGPSHRKQVEKGELSGALTERIVPSLIWSDDPSHTGLAPLVPLTLDETYTLATGDPPSSWEVQVAPAGPPLLPRFWPPADLDATGTWAIYCGPTALPYFEARTEVLAPDGVVATVRWGAFEGQGDRCLRIDLENLESSTAGCLPPSAIDLENGMVLLDPAPLGKVADAPLVEPLTCDLDELPMGPGCLRVQDDRAWLRSPRAPLFWLLSSADGLLVAETTRDRAVVRVGPLPPSSDLTMTFVALELSGAATTGTLSLRTQAPMAHMVLNEVLANPIGAEPDQEWVELTNDGVVSGDLADYVLEDAGGLTLLPSAVVAPGELVLLVNDSYDVDASFDVLPDDGTVLVRVPALGKNGLSNSGEALLLRDPEGRVVSQFPASPKPHAGESVARVRPDALDSEASSFVRAAPTPGWPNGLEAP